MAQLKRYSSITGDDGHPDDLHFELEVVFREPGPEFRKPPIEETYDPPLPPVDGGIKAWSSIAGGFLALFVQFGLGKWRSGQIPTPNSRWSDSFYYAHLNPDSPPLHAHRRWE